jgi:hypothetical protein
VYHKASTLGLLLLDNFINGICAKINYSKFLLFADGSKIYRDLKSVEDCKTLQANTESEQQWCGKTHTELYVQKTKIIFFTLKTNIIHFNYEISDVLILRSDGIKDIVFMLDSKLYFHYHAYYVHSQAVRALVLIRYITYNFSPLDSLIVLCNASIGSKLEYASVVRIKLTSIGCDILECG